MTTTAAIVPQKTGLPQFFETTPSGRQAQYLNVLIALLVGAHNPHLSRVASKVPSSAKRESQIKQFSRLLQVEGWNEIIHRTDRCDLSLFSLGLALLDHFTNLTLPIPVAFIPFSLELL